MYHLIDYVWCIDKFSSYLDKQECVAPAASAEQHHHHQHIQQQQQCQNVYSLLTSPVFAYKNTRWVLNLYPEGLGDASSAGYVSLFIKYVSEEPESICAKVELSLLNNKNERVYLRDTGDHVYQTFIDFGYKQFVKLVELREQRNDLLTSQGSLKVFARVEFEMAGSLPSSVTWANYDLLLFKEQFKTLYESKHLCDILVRVVRTNKQRQHQNHLQHDYHQKQQQQQQYSLPVIINSNGGGSLAVAPRLLHHESNSSFSPPKSKRMKLSDTQVYDAVENTSLQSPTTHRPHRLLVPTCKCYSIDFSSSPTCSGSSVYDHHLHNQHHHDHHSHLDSHNNQHNHDKYSRSSYECAAVTAATARDNHQDTQPLDAYTDDGDVENDCEIGCGGGAGGGSSSSSDQETLDIKAHKFILASRSGKFRELLKTSLIKMSYLTMLPKSNGPCSCVCTCDSGDYYGDEDDDDGDEYDGAYVDCMHSTSIASSSTASSSSSFSNNYDDCGNKNDADDEEEEKDENDDCPCRHINHHHHECLIEATPDASESPSLSSSSNPSSSSPSLYNFHEDNESDNVISDLLIIETDRSPKVIEYLIRYMYTGYLDSLDSYAREIYEVSKEFKVHGLTALAREHLAKELSVANCCDFLIFGVCQNDYELNTRVHAFIEENYAHVVRTHAYKQARRKYRELIENTFSEIARKMSPPPSSQSQSSTSTSTSISTSSFLSSSSSSSSSSPPPPLPQLPLTTSTSSSSSSGSSLSVGSSSSISRSTNTNRLASTLFSTQPSE